MRRLLSLLCLLTISLPPDAYGQQPTYVLIAALGDTFNVVIEEQGIGSNMSPYKRTALPVADNLLNKLVLRDLDAMVETAYPGSQRITIAMRPPNLRTTPHEQRGQASLDAVLDYLKQQPQRTAWERVIVVTPAYRALDKDDMAANLEGMGLLLKPLCQSADSACSTNARSTAGPEVATLNHDTVYANSYAAPYSYITVWQIDPATLQVISQRTTYSKQKIADERGELRGVLQDENKGALAQQLVKLVSVSVHDALKRTEFTGHVEVRDVHEVPAPPSD
ncbi:hypothetical protein GJ699_17050 [Duganella sp. FT80W]|uniref:Uncharacterized protein n=1 Tax=Duganella guangzhouensis TaxID=2666084 RepID=A0A6I2L1F5_9BURK|nr:hypothetical protein [Duganella guangzhouensis]MRW91703.1 hypothetical protein [Duganella guangzhouensis]